MDFYRYCSLSTFLDWLQYHLLKCPFKSLTGIDCPGCGFQRSVIALLRGNLNESLNLYAATLPLMFLIVFSVAESRLKFDKRDYIKKTIYILVASIITVSYINKCIQGAL